MWSKTALYAKEYFGTNAFAMFAISFIHSILREWSLSGLEYLLPWSTRREK